MFKQFVIYVTYLLTFVNTDAYIKINLYDDST